MGLSFFAKASTQEILSRAQVEHWHEDVQWLRLLQYQPRFFGGLKSEAGSDKFFLHPQGATHPDLELQATIESLLENKRLIQSRDAKFNEPVACVFPARRLWLEKKIAAKLPKVSCERFDRFKDILKAQSLTYVFSSYYLNNPASGFGHAFLRVNKAPSAKDGERYELADYGIGYAALQVSDNPLVYSLLGISGFMPGAFDVNPYYFKVREYNDFESRDLWEYDLNFTPQEVEFIIAYIWELSDVNFDYHYFSQNCSYRILSVLETARADLHLIDELKWQVMPADTVQTVYRAPGLVTHIHFRPSVRATFLNRVLKLSQDSKQKINTFAKDESLAPLKDKETLDAAMDYLDYRYPSDILKKTGKYSLKKEVLMARAEVGGVSESLPMTIPWSEAPHDAEGSRRLGLGYRHWQNDGEASLISAKLSLHDLLDPKIGYPSGAQITMGDFAFGWNKKFLSIEKFTVFEVVSLAPLDEFSKNLSWRLKISNDRGYENNCAGLCHWSEISGGVGLTKTWFESLDAGIWLRLGAQYNPDFSAAALRAGAGPAAMLRWNRGIFSLLGESYYRYDYKGAASEFRENSLSAQLTPEKSWAVRAGVQANHMLSIFDTQFFYYY